MRFAVADGRGPALTVTIALENVSGAPMEIGDLALPLPMNGHFKGGQPVTAAVLKHSFVSGHGSRAYWMRANRVGPYLMMMPDRDTHFEYWDRGKGFCAYGYAAKTEAEVRATGTRWRQPVPA